MHFLQTLPKEVSQSTATKVESGISDANRRFLVCEILRRVKKDRTLVKKKLRSSLSQRAAEHPMQWVKKQRTGLLNRHPFERTSSSIKAKVEVRDLRGILVRSSRAQSQAVGRSIYIYIYIANGESPSQHVSVGLAEARPNE